MLIKISDHIRPTNSLQKTYQGRVLLTDADEDKKLGRIKVLVPGLWEETDLAKLPWIYPKHPAGLGGSNVTSNFMVPNVGSYINVEFPYEDVYSGFYTSYFHDPNTHIGIFNEDYPSSYGWRDEQNTYFKVNRAKKSLELHHASGAALEMAADSEITMRSRKGMRFVSEDGQTELFFDMVTGKIQMSPKDGLEMGGPKTTVNSKTHNVEVGELNETVSGSKEQLVVGSYRKRIGGSYSQTVVGSVAKSATGDYAETVAGEAGYTYGTGKKEDVVLGDMEASLVLGDRKIDIILGDYKTSIILGNYNIDVKAGNLSFKTLAGSVEMKNLLAKLEMGIPGDVTLGNLLGKMEINPAGGVSISATLNAEVKALLNASLQAAVLAEVKAAIVKLGPGIAPVLTQLTSPFVDLITGVPSIGVPTVLA
jgi:hypothetical protein